MKRNLICFVLSLGLALITTGCGNTTNELGKASTSMEETSMNNQSAIDRNTSVPDTNTALITNSEVKESQDQFVSFIQSLDVDLVDAISLEVYAPDQQIFRTVNKSVIQQWISLLKKMKITGTSYQDLYGTGYMLSIEQGGQKKDIGFFMTSNITTDETRTMYQIANFNELSDEFLTAEKTLGFYNK